MRVLVAGATGVLGRPLVAQLVASGHDVIGVARRRESAEALEKAGGAPLVVNILGPDAATALAEVRPDVIVHAATALRGSLLNPVTAMRSFSRTNALRREGTRTLIRAARSTGARVVAASIAFAYAPGPGVRTEDDPLWVEAPGLAGRVNRAVAELERQVLDSEGVVLRFGSFYGPGTYYAADGAFIDMVRRRLLPLVDNGRGVYSFVHTSDAARATESAMTAPSGAYNVADRRSVMTAHEWITHAAMATGAKSPRRLPRALTNHGPGTLLTYMIADQPAVSTAKVESCLGWAAEEPPWRDTI